MDPTKLLKDRQVVGRKIEEAAYEEALREFQSGELRPGIMAKALAESGGDENKAKASYIQLAARAILDDHYIAQRSVQPRGDAEVIFFGAMSLVIPGLGQLFQGRIGAAIGFFLFAAALWLVLLGWIIHIWAMVNAAKYERAKHNPPGAAG